jgi:hypothetical protein
MTVTSGAAVEPDDKQIEKGLIRNARSRLQDVLVATAPVFGVVLSSAVGVLLFLR